jgi:hypothetical protein
MHGERCNLSTSCGLRYGGGMDSNMSKSGVASSTRYRRLTAASLDGRQEDEWTSQACSCIWKSEDGL